MKHQSIYTKSILVVLLANLIWGSLGIAARNANISGVSLLLLESIIAFIAYLVWVFVKKKKSILKKFEFNKDTVRFMFFQSLLGIFAFLALTSTDIPTSASFLILTATPITIVFIAPLLSDSKSSKYEISMAFMGFFGLAIFLADDSITSRGLIISAGLIFAFLSLFANSFASIYNKKVADVSPSSLLPLYVIVGNFLFAPFYFLIAREVPFEGIQTIDFLIAAYSGIFSILIAFTLLAKSFKVLSVQFVSILGLTSPIFAAIFGILFLNENMTLQMIIGGGIVLVSIGILIKSQSNKK